MNAVHEPLHGKKLDSQHEFIVEWQVFTLDGKPEDDLHRASVTINNGKFSSSDDHHYILQDPLVVDKLQRNAVIGGLYLVGAINDTCEAFRLSYYLGVAIRQGYTLGKKDSLLVEEVADWESITDEIKEIMRFT
ncbi:hypothetical protein N7478_012331 [Penicillium angulare]|uniref:uncharacterized protein n=1 Tax=Penicillium angulare TaxID=116970 RepID=UPI00253FA074|nr:uncharacterized protein N7478_012331 [Penicillium angulare]KAJ5259350.1 hypothetical protein N7478_012331 [Penicillium angulare]